MKSSRNGAWGGYIRAVHGTQKGTNVTIADRKPLTRDRIVEAAIAFADEHGVDALSMRKLGGMLGVEAMSLYNHVSSKDEILEGMVDALFANMGPASDADDDWQEVTRRTALAARREFAAHPWAIVLLGSRETMTMGVLGLMERLIGLLLAEGHTPEIAHHGWHTISCHVMGFALWDSLNFGGEKDEDAIAEMEQFIRANATTYPALAVSGHVMADCDHDHLFEFGLDLILNGIESLPKG